MRNTIRSFLEAESVRIGRMPTVSLIGLGKTTLALLDIIKDICPVTLRDERAGIPLPCNGITALLGDGALDDIYEDIVIPSPSVRRDRLKFRRGCRPTVTSDTELFFSLQPKNVFAVTGSDGKSTVCAMTGEILKRVFPDIFIGGNIGNPIANADLAHTDAYVLELSSFSLMYTHPVTVRAAITNISENHLNWHSGYGEYKKAKLRIFSSSEGAVTDIDSAPCLEAVRDRHICCAVSDRHTHARLVRTLDTEHTVTSSERGLLLDGEPLIPRERLRPAERHNIKNLMLAVGLTLGYADADAVLNAQECYRPLAHRCERFLTHGGIEYIDSSIDTSPMRCAATLEGLGRRVHLLLGGSGKGLSYEPLIPALEKYADRISLYGNEGQSLDRWLGTVRSLSHIERRYHPDFASSVCWLCGGARKGDTVILSPASTSYGEFRDFCERGETFKRLVRERYKI